MVNKAEIDRLMGKADRYQAVLSCLAQGDCERLRRFEARDRIALQAAQHSQPTSGHVSTNLTGSWSDGRGNTWHISQQGRSLTVTVLDRPTFTGSVTSPRNIVVHFTDDQGCCTATVDDHGRTLSWSNGTRWTR